MPSRCWWSTLPPRAVRFSASWRGGCQAIEGPSLALLCTSSDGNGAGFVIGNICVHGAVGSRAFKLLIKKARRCCAMSVHTVGSSPYEKCEWVFRAEHRRFGEEDLDPPRHRLEPLLLGTLPKMWGLLEDYKKIRKQAHSIHRFCTRGPEPTAAAQSVDIERLTAREWLNRRHNAALGRHGRMLRVREGLFL